MLLDHGSGSPHAVRSKSAVDRAPKSPQRSAGSALPVTRHAGASQGAQCYRAPSGASRPHCDEGKEMKAPARAALTPGADESRLSEMLRLRASAGCLTSEPDKTGREPLARRHARTMPDAGQGFRNAKMEGAPGSLRRENPGPQTSPNLLFSFSATPARSTAIARGQHPKAFANLCTAKINKGPALPQSRRAPPGFPGPPKRSPPQPVTTRPVTTRPVATR